MSIAIRHISKQFGAFKALDNVSIDIPSGELVALLGPSGCGKTTLLRIIAGLDFADQGQILLEGDDASARHVRDRQVGFVFQHYALFRHMSVADNVAFGLRVKPRRLRPSEAEIKRRVKRLLELVQLDWLADRYPSQLSGGQRQRIALARALAVEPKVLLLDEPFGALDAKVRKELRRWLRQLHDEIHVTSVFVTHDQEEALEVSDRVVVINKGKVEQIGTPESVYDHPATPFVANFLGSVNLFHGRVENGHLHVGDDALALGSTDGSNGQAVAFVRPHEFDLLPGWEVGGGLPARIVRVVSVGPSAQIELSRADGELIEVSLARETFHLLGLAEGDPVSLRPSHIRVFSEEARRLEDGMNFQQLRIIRETVRQDFNLTEVANALYTSQPGVSKHIKDLEDELGIEIFVRRGKRLLGLTEPGKELAEVVNRILLDTHNLRRIADQFASRETGHFVVATTHTQARYALPQIIKWFKTDYPRVHLALHQGSPVDIAEKLVTGEADVGIATERLDQVPELATFPFYRWYHAVIVPYGHPLLKVRDLTLELIGEYPIITYHEGFTGRTHIDKAFADAGVVPDIVLSAIDADVIKTYVELDLGVGIIASMAYDGFKDRNLTLIPVPHLFPESTTRLAVRRGTYLRSYALAFIEKVCPDIGEDNLRAVIQKQNGGE